MMRLGLLVLCLWLSSAAAAQDVALVTAAGQRALLADPGTPIVGAQKPDVIVVEYFDYNCPYCKKFVPTLQALLAQDPKIGIVYKEWPILGPVSQYAAAAALAAGWQGKYLAAHDALIGGPRLAANTQVDALLQKAGVDISALTKDRTQHAKEIQALLARNDQEAHALSLDGTPALVVGRLRVPGVVGIDDLKKMIAQSRLSK
jgi:protein-disulfide isomerase